jgi:predicted Holliday junction resolvase-like endonuclease
MTSILEELRTQNRIRVRCPNCQRDFPVTKAALFDGTKTLPAGILEIIRDRRDRVCERRKQLLEGKRRASEGARITAKAVNIGKTAEKIAPSLPGFPLEPGDCRSLLEPIDYLVFKGLAVRRKVEAIVFTEVKTGQARLSNVQRKVKELVNAGKVSLDVSSEQVSEARHLIEAWRQDYNQLRPHSSLGTLAPAEYANRLGGGPPEQAQGSAARPLAPPPRLGQNINPGLYS